MQLNHKGTGKYRTEITVSGQIHSFRCAACTHEKLASALGIKPSALKATIEEFNAAVQEGSFKPVVPDGKRTRGIMPPKSNWARTIDGP